MARNATYYLSRIIKQGVLDTEGVLRSLRDSPSIGSRKFDWTVIDIDEDIVTQGGQQYNYLFGNLVKYEPEGTVKIVDEKSRRSKSQIEPNMLRASCPFVYFPSEAIFGHKLIWNEIDDKDFRGNIKKIITQYHDVFFVDCELSAVSDLNMFSKKLAELDRIRNLAASVKPPNPLFGAFWKDLKDYLDERRLQRLQLREEASSGESLPTQVPEIARRMAATESNDAESDMDAISPVPIGDAAILMAADGYGSAQVTGTRDGQETTIKTSGNALEIKLSSDTTSAELALAVVKEIIRMATNRRQSH